MVLLRTKLLILPFSHLRPPRLLVKTVRLHVPPTVLTFPQLCATHICMTCVMIYDTSDFYTACSACIELRLASNYLEAAYLLLITANYTILYNMCHHTPQQLKTKQMQMCFPQHWDASRSGHSASISGWIVTF